MSNNKKTIAADPKANVTPTETKAAAVDTTTENKATTKTVTEKAATKTSKETTKPATKVAKKPAEKKTVTKAPAKTIKKSVEVNASYILQFSGKEIVAKDILENVKTVWVEKFQGKLEEIKTIELYIKPEENRAYFVVNGLSNGDYFVEL